MKAIRIEEFGGPETLRLRNLELSDLGPGEVRIKLHAAGLNFVDVNLRRGEVRAAGPNFVDVYPSRGEDPSSLPFTPGFDGAGIIDAVGEGVKEFKPGNRVAPDPIQPLSLIWRGISISGGMLGHFTRTREELLRRADDVLNGIREGWLRLHIDKVFPLVEAAQAQRRLENRESTGKIILQTAA